MPVELQLERAKGRRALCGLVRPVLAAVCIAIILGQQPFMQRQRQRQRIAPLQLAISGAVQSPVARSNPGFQATVNRTSRLLLTPLAYYRAPPKKRTVELAYGKTEKLLQRIVDGTSSLDYTAEVAAAPMPNIPLIGAWLLMLGSFAAVLCPGAEALILAGCGCLSIGCAGMDSQPELFTVVALAVLGLVARSHVRAPVRITEPKLRSRHGSRKTRPRGDCCGEAAEDRMPSRMRNAMNKPHAE